MFPKCTPTGYKRKIFSSIPNGLVLSKDLYLLTFLLGYVGKICNVLQINI